MLSDYIFTFTDPSKGSFVVKPYTANGPLTPSDHMALYTNGSVSAVSANTSLALLGRGVVDYNIIQNNLLFLMENFAGPTRPFGPTTGQLWYKTTNGTNTNFPTDPTVRGLYIWNSSSWDPVHSGTLITGDLDVGGYRIINVGTPTNPTDAITIQYANDNYIGISGGTLSGNLVLNADPTLALGAATKQYVDAVASSLAGKLNVSGDTMTGLLVLSGNPTIDLHAATKQYVDVSVGNLVLENLTNVHISGAATGDALTFDGTRWINQPVTAGSADGVVYGGGLTSWGDLTLYRTNSLPDVVIPGISPLVHFHRQFDVGIDHTLASYPETVLFADALEAGDYPVESLQRVISILDQAAYNASRPTHRQLIVGDGTTTTTTLRFDMIYTVGTNKLQVFRAGTKLYADDRGSATVTFDRVGAGPTPKPAMDLNLTPGTTYTFDVTVGGTTTTISITTPSTVGYMFQQLLEDIRTQTAGLGVVVRDEQYSSSLNIVLETSAVGAGATVSVADGVVSPLFSSIAASTSALFTIQTPVAGGTYDYAEIGIPGAMSNQLTFHAPMTLGSVYEILL